MTVLSCFVCCLQLTQECRVLAFVFVTEFKFSTFDFLDVFSSPEAVVTAYQDVVVVVLHGILSDREIDILRDVIDLNLRNPGPLTGVGGKVLIDSWSESTVLIGS